MADIKTDLAAEFSRIVQQGAIKGLEDAFKNAPEAMKALETNLRKQFVAAHNNPVHAVAGATAGSWRLSSDPALAASRMSALQHIAQAEGRRATYNIAGRVGAGRWNWQSDPTAGQADFFRQTARQHAESVGSRVLASRAPGESARDVKRRLQAAMAPLLTPSADHGVEAAGQRAAVPEIRRMRREMMEGLDAEAAQEREEREVAREARQTRNRGMALRNRMISRGEITLREHERIAWLNERFGGAAQMFGISPNTARLGAGVGQIAGGIMSGNPLIGMAAGASGGATLGAEGLAGMAGYAIPTAIAAGLAGMVKNLFGHAFDADPAVSMDRRLRQIASRAGKVAGEDIMLTWRADKDGSAAQASRRQLTAAGFSPEEIANFFEASTASGRGIDEALNVAKWNMAGVSTGAYGNLLSTIRRRSLGGDASGFASYGVNRFGTAGAEDFINEAIGIGNVRTQLGLSTLSQNDMARQFFGTGGLGFDAQMAFVKQATGMTGQMASSGGSGFGNNAVNLLAMSAFGGLDLSKRGGIGPKDFMAALEQMETASPAQGVKNLFAQMGGASGGDTALQEMLSLGLLKSLGFNMGAGKLRNILAGKDEMGAGVSNGSEAEWAGDARRNTTELLGDRAATASADLALGYTGAATVTSLQRVAAELRSHLSALPALLTQLVQAVEHAANVGGRR